MNHKVTKSEKKIINKYPQYTMTLIVKNKKSGELLYPNFINWREDDEFRYAFYHLSKDGKEWEDWGGK